MPEKLFKVIIIGDPTVGKTAFVKRYVQNAFTRQYKGTVGVDFALKIVKVSDTETIKLQLWDIAGLLRRIVSTSSRNETKNVFLGFA